MIRRVAPHVEVIATAREAQNAELLQRVLGVWNRYRR